MSKEPDYHVIDHALDVFGVPVRAGDYVLHIVTSGSSPVFTRSRVREVRERKPAYGPDGWHQTLAVEKPMSGHKTEISFMKRVIRCPDGWEPPKPRHSFDGDQIW